MTLKAYDSHCREWRKRLHTTSLFFPPEVIDSREGRFTRAKKGMSSTLRRTISYRGCFCRVSGFLYLNYQYTNYSNSKLLPASRLAIDTLQKRLIEAFSTTISSIKTDSDLLTLGLTATQAWKASLCLKKWLSTEG